MESIILQVENALSSTLMWLFKLPYFVERTAKGRWLPVYTDIKRSGFIVQTIIRRIYGNREALAKELEEHLGIKSTIKENGLCFKGNVTIAIKRYLTLKGF